MDTLAYHVSRLSKHFVRFCEEPLRELGLTHGLLYFLIYVGKRPDCTPTELSAGLEADSGHTARSLDKLAALGYLLRERSDTDRRAYRLRLTERGEAAFGVLEGLFGRWDKAVCAGMEPEARERLLAALEGIEKTLGDERYV